MTLDRFLVLSLLAMGVLTLCYLWHAERMRRLGEALYEACGGDLETAYLAVQNMELEREIVSAAARSPAAIWRANSPAPRAALRIVDGGRPARFDDDPRPPSPPEAA